LVQLQKQLQKTTPKTPIAPAPRPPTPPRPPIRPTPFFFPGIRGKKFDKDELVEHWKTRWVLPRLKVLQEKLIDED